MTAPTSSFSGFALEPFPEVRPGDNLADVIIGVLDRSEVELEDGDVLVVASKAVSIAEMRYVELAGVSSGPEAMELAARTGKPAGLVQLILDASSGYFLATPTGPIIARHTLGLQLTSAGVDRAGSAGAWLLPVDPDASARALRDALTAHTGAGLAVIVVDSDGRADRRGATVVSIGAAGIRPLRVTEYDGKRQEETFTDLVAAAGGIILGQRGRGAPVAVLRGLSYEAGDEGVAAMLHNRP
ncbi:coenzyme F420-0:L-glutamate ligase [Streptomyces sp. NPDC048717]|uniref:coenzyme F420-0:L-glutamate ligase n=1 Tax=Streptomyces sp. NPDC048717 TaxID=3154928 RepID=UPI0034350B2F